MLHFPLQSIRLCSADRETSCLLVTQLEKQLQGRQDLFRHGGLIWLHIGLL